MKKNLTLIIILCSISIIAQTGQTIPGTIKSGDLTYSYTMYVPAMYDGTVEVPLVFNIHGLSGSSDVHEKYQDFRTIADTENFIVVHPQAQGTPGFLSNPQTSWDVWGDTVATGDVDRGVIMNLLDEISDNYNINNNRIYATGFSQGGYMTYNLACIFSERFAAVAPVAGSMGATYFNECAPTHPMPVMEIHGTTDQLVSYEGGSANTTATDAIVDYWVNYNNCDSEPTTYDTLTDISTSDSCFVIHSVYTVGDLSTTVEFYKIIGGGHQVPTLYSDPNPTYSIGNRNEDFDAATEIWRFFSQYTLDAVGGTGVTGIDNPGVSTTGIIVYPNPSNGQFTVEIEELNNSSIKIFNNIGTKVLQQQLNSIITQIDTRPLSNGIYYYKVNDKSGKLIIQ